MGIYRFMCSQPEGSTHRGELLSVDNIRCVILGCSNASVLLLCVVIKAVCNFVAVLHIALKTVIAKIHPVLSTDKNEPVWRSLNTN